MMKAKYLIALVCISLSLAACSEPTTTSSTESTERISKLKKDLDKTFKTGPITRAEMKEDGMHVYREGKEKIVIPLKDLEKLEQGSSTDVEKDPSSLNLKLFNDANAKPACRWITCGDGWPGQTPTTCPYAC